MYNAVIICIIIALLNTLVTFNPYLKYLIYIDIFSPLLIPVPEVKFYHIVFNLVLTALLKYIFIYRCSLKVSSILISNLLGFYFIYNSIRKPNDPILTWKIFLSYFLRIFIFYFIYFIAKMIKVYLLFLTNIYKKKVYFLPTNSLILEKILQVVKIYFKECSIGYNKIEKLYMIGGNSLTIQYLTALRLSSYHDLYSFEKYNLKIPKSMIFLFFINLLILGIFLLTKWKGIFLVVNVLITTSFLSFFCFLGLIKNLLLKWNKLVFHIGITGIFILIVPLVEKITSRNPFIFNLLFIFISIFSYFLPKSFFER